MRELVSTTVVIVGLGSAFRSDDGVGPRVADLAARATGAAIVGPYSDPLDLLGEWDDADLAVVIDATRSGAAPGTVRVIVLDADATSPADHGGAGLGSTHGIGLAGVLRLARAVGRAPRRVAVVGVEGELFDHGETLSPGVEAAVPEAVRCVTRLVDEAVSCA